MSDTLNIVKQKLIESILLSNSQYELIHLSFARLYTGNKNQTWLYSELEGALTLVLDYTKKTAKFIMFDLITMEIIFECEWYKNFNIFYTVINDNFQCFEVNGGFIGFNIPNQNDANILLKNVMKLTDMVIIKKTKDKLECNLSEIKKIGENNLKTLNKKVNEEYFFKNSLPYEEKISFDAYQLEKLFDIIEWDEESSSFLIKGNLEEMEDLVQKVSAMRYAGKAGKVNDLRSYAMEVYNNIKNSSKANKDIEMKKNIKKKEQLIKDENERKLKEKKDKELEKEREKERKLQEKKEKEREKERKLQEKKEKEKQKKGAPNSNSNVPAVPKGVPPVPKGVPAVPKGIPPVPKGVPAVPKGVPAVPKGVPQVPKVVPKVAVSTSTSQVGTQENKDTGKGTTGETDGIDLEGTTGSTDPNEIVKEEPKKRAPPKMNLMDELKLKLQKRNAPKMDDDKSDKNMDANKNKNTETEKVLFNNRKIYNILFYHILK